jgi:hypothetical protein
MNDEGDGAFGLNLGRKSKLMRAFGPLLWGTVF